MSSEYKKIIKMSVSVKGGFVKGNKVDSELFDIDVETDTLSAAVGFLSHTVTLIDKKSRGVYAVIAIPGHSKNHLTEEE